MPFVSASASSRCSVETYSSPSSFGFVFGLVEDLVELARHRRLRVALLRILVDAARDLLAQRGDAGAELLENGNDDALVLLEERGEQMEVVDERIAVSAGEVGGFVERLAGLHGQFFWN